MREKMEIEDVLQWLLDNHPTLHKTAEIDRAWLWICADLRGEENKATRESIKEYGFRFARSGHRLPSGNLARWAHACLVPLPFKHKGKQTKKSARPGQKGSGHEPTSRHDPLANYQRPEPEPEWMKEAKEVFA